MEKKIEQYVKKVALEKGIIVDYSTDLFESGIFDSLEIIEFLTYLEEEMQINFELNDLDFENFQTITAIVQWLNINGK